MLEEAKREEAMKPLFYKAPTHRTPCELIE